MKNQEEHFGAGSINILENILSRTEAKKIFLVTGKKSFELSGAGKIFRNRFSDFDFEIFNDFGVIPEVESVKTGIERFRNSGSDCIVAVGGGNVIDTAKAVNILSFQAKNPEEYITGKSEITNTGKYFIAVPTTSGSGSEATHFAVVYNGKKKFSLADERILPDCSIVDPELTLNLPPEITAVSGMDALSQSIESYWSVNSTEESRSYSEKAIKSIFENLNSAVSNPDIRNRTEMSKASNLSGKSINITKTTAPHAVSYIMTSEFGIPHGQAVSITLGEFLVYNSAVSEKDITDPRGTGYVRENFVKLLNIMKCRNSDEGRDKIKNLMKSINLKISLKELGISGEREINFIVDNVNTERLRNNPRKLTSDDLRILLRNIM